jgi:VWFA-related protein
MRRPLSVMLASLVAIASGPLPAQQIPSLGETMEIAIVNVDVVVTDRDGRRVRGLTKDDFTILENGRPQPITHFAEYSDGASESSTSVAVAQSTAPEQKRTLVLFLEPFQAKRVLADEFARSLKRLVRDTVRPGDSISIVVFDRNASTWLEPTDDLDAVEYELDRFAGLLGAHVDRTGGVASDVTQMMRFEQEGAAMSRGRGVKRPETSGETIASNVAQSAAMLSEFEMRKRVAAINAAVNALAGIEGKKVMIVAAHRLGSFSGAEFFFSAGATIREGVEKGQMSERGVSKFFLAMGSSVVPAGDADALDNRKRVRELIANANAAGVSLYPIFPAGLDQTPVDPDIPDTTRAVLANEMSMRQEIAKETGGLTTYGTVNFVKMLPEIAGDLSNYYSLAYRVPASGTDGARDLVVRTRDSKLEVRARRQFVEKSDESRMKDRVVAALYGMSEASPIELAAKVGESKDARGPGRRSVPVSIQVPIRALTLVPQDGISKGAFSVYVMTGSEKGEVSEVTRRTQAFEIPAADVDRALIGHFTYELEVVVNKGADHVAIGVIDEVSKTHGVVRLALASR